jgi:hypothetical protein
MNNRSRRGIALRILVIGLFASACSIQGPAADSSAEPSSSHIATDPSPVSRPPTATPSLAPTAPSSELPSPTAYARPGIPYPDHARPALQYPDLESYGAARISFNSQDQPASVGSISCLWRLRISEVSNEPEIVAVRGPSFVLAGERVDIWLGWHSPFAIHRHGAASYVAGPGSGFVEGVGGDGSSSRKRFDGLTPSSETAPPLTTSLTEWVRPLGGDPAWATLTGTVEWACEPPPPNLSEAPYSCVLPPGPLCLGDPDPIVLVVTRRQFGVNACGGLLGETCGLPFYALSTDYVVRVPTGHTLRFELPDERSHFLRWSLEWAAQTDAERWQIQYESDGPWEEEEWEMIDDGGPSEGSVLEFAAPPPGDWSVLLSWTDDRDDNGGNMRSFFRVVVSD